VPAPGGEVDGLVVQTTGRVFLRLADSMGIGQEREGNCLFNREMQVKRERIDWSVVKGWERSFVKPSKAVRVCD
jgi:hypothetical protein